MQFPKFGIVGFPFYGKSMGKKKHSKIIRFRNISCEAEIHTIPKHRMREFPFYGTSMGKHRQFLGSTLPYRVRVNGNP